MEKVYKITLLKIMAQRPILVISAASLYWEIPNLISSLLVKVHNKPTIAMALDPEFGRAGDRSMATSSTSSRLYNNVRSCSIGLAGTLWPRVL